MIKAETTSKLSKDKQEVLSGVTKRLNINIPEETHMKLKIKAIQEKKTVTEVVLAMINKYVK